jgi:hypothetical protein
MSKLTLINSLDRLKELASEEDGVGCYIRLGVARSSKNMWYHGDDLWSVHNEIDDTFQGELTTKELGEKTNIIHAIEKQSLFLY